MGTQVLEVHSRKARDLDYAVLSHQSSLLSLAYVHQSRGSIDLLNQEFQKDDITTASHEHQRDWDGWMHVYLCLGRSNNQNT